MTLPLRHNFVNGVNHLHNDRWWGNRTIGRKSPIQAAYDGAGDYYAICWPEVLPWPFSEDQHGTPFSQSTIVGVRTRCIRKADGGEDNFLVAAPRSLPSGYTRMGRCGHLASINSAIDYIGSNPMAGCSPTQDGYGNPGPVYWRGPDGIAPWPDGYTWTPMNLNDQTLDVSIDDNPFGEWYTEDLDPGPDFDIQEWYLQSVGQHVGFRGAQIDGLTLIGADGGSPGAITGDIGLYFGWTDPDDPDPVTIDDINVLWSQIFSGGSMTDNNGPAGSQPYSHLWDIQTGSLLVSTIGRKMKYWVAMSSHTSGYYNGTEFTLRLGPRTDVPLWFFSASGNLCAPGGIAMP